MCIRDSGWVAHWNEMHQAPLTIYRPRQIYVGEEYRDYVCLLYTSGQDYSLKLSLQNQLLKALEEKSLVLGLAIHRFLFAKT